MTYSDYQDDPIPAPPKKKTRGEGSITYKLDELVIPTQCDICLTKYSIFKRVCDNCGHPNPEYETKFY